MKKLYIILTLITIINANAQNSSLELRDIFNIQPGAHYKDTGNVFDDYVGTWVYTHNDTSLKIILAKQSDVFNPTKGGYFEDLIVGEYQYIENGTEKINTLSSIGSNLGWEHTIYGNLIYRNCYFMPRGDCIEGETRLHLGLIDPITPHYATMVLKKRVVNGQEAIKAFIYFKYAGPYMGVGVPNPSPTMPWQQEYTLFKQ